LSEPAGQHVELGQGYLTQGAVSTTDHNGNPSCLYDEYTGLLPTPIGVYTGRVISTYLTTSSVVTNTTITNGYTSLVTWTSTSIYQKPMWIMPDLTDYVPGVAAFEECTYIIAGGSPIALTPVNEIVLPAVTLPFRQASASLTSTVEQPSKPTTTRPPTTSEVVTLPSSTTSRQQSDTDPATEAEPAPSQETTHTDSAIVTPTKPSASSDRGAVTDDLPDGPRSPGSSVLPIPPASQDEADETINPVAVTVDSSSPSQLDAPRSSSVQSTHGVPDNSAGNSDSRPTVEYVEPTSAPSSRLGGTSSTIDIVRVSPKETPDSSDGFPASVVAVADQPFDQFASYIAAGISGNSADVDGSDAGSYILMNGATIAASEPAVVVTGTTFSALSSGSGVVAVADGTSTTLTTLPPAGSTPPFRVPVAPNEDAKYVVQDGSTVTAGGQAISVSGTKYSALPSNSGVVVVANGQSTTMEAASLPAPPPQNSPDAYILGGSVTVSAGGSAQTISGTTYSALPSDPGILVVANGETTTLVGSSISGSDTGDAVNSYIIDGTATISAGGSVVAISGTTYLALPSGPGVVAIENGKSSTIGEDGHLVANATGGAGQQDGFMPFMGGAVDSRARLNSLASLIVAIALLACFV
jgi:hypothetical protein